MFTQLIIKKTPTDETFISREEGDQWRRRRRRVSRYANQFHAQTKDTSHEGSAL